MENELTAKAKTPTIDEVLQKECKNLVAIHESCLDIKQRICDTRGIATNICEIHTDVPDLADLEKIDTHNVQQTLIKIEDWSRTIQSNLQTINQWIAGLNQDIRNDLGFNEPDEIKGN